MIINFDDQTLEEKIKTGAPLVVDFWAEWCGPCRMLSPIIEELSNDFQGKVTIGKLNVDEYSSSAGTYGIRSIPTVLFFNRGELVEKFTGVAAKGVFEEKINELIGEQD